MVFKSIKVQFIVTIIISLVIQFLMLIQNMVAASNFGISHKMDAFNIAYTITTFIFSFFAAAVNTILIPSLVQKKFLSINIFITVLLITLSILGTLILLFKDFIVIYVGGDLGSSNITSQLLIILTLGYIFKSITGVTNAIYQTNERYVLPKLSQMLSMIVVVLVIYFLSKNNIYIFTIAVALGFITDFLIQTILMKGSYFKFKFSLNFKDKDFLIMAKSFFPIFLGTGLFQLSLLIDVTLASRLGEGNVSLLSYSNQIVSMINALIVINIISFMYPKMTKLISEDSFLAQKSLLKNIILSVFIMFYIVSLYIVLGKETISLFFQRGMFTQSITDIVYNLSVLYFLTLPFTIVRDLFYRYFYGDQDTLTPLKNSLSVTIIKIVISFPFAFFLGLYGLVLSTIIGNIISTISIFYKFKKKYSIKFNLKMLINELTKLLASSIGAVLITLLIKQHINSGSDYINMLVIIIVSTGSYILLCYLFKFKLVIKKNVKNI